MSEQVSGTHGPREDDAIKRQDRSELHAHGEGMAGARVVGRGRVRPETQSRPAASGLRHRELTRPPGVSSSGRAAAACRLPAPAVRQMRRPRDGGCVTLRPSAARRRDEDRQAHQHQRHAPAEPAPGRPCQGLETPHNIKEWLTAPLDKPSDDWLPSAHERTECSLWTVLTSRTILALGVQIGGSARVLPDLVHHSSSPSIDVVGAA